MLCLGAANSERFEGADFPVRFVWDGEAAPRPVRIDEAEMAKRLMETVRVEQIRVEDDRIVFTVRVTTPLWHRTTFQLTAQVLELHPHLIHHACVNAKGTVFGAVIFDTPLPHLLEHLAIDILSKTSSNPHITHVGTSSWIDEVQGTACVQISMRDDLEVLSAFNQAVSIVNDLTSS